jgi:transcriptional regulator with XRE-family HTH domain
MIDPARLGPLLSKRRKREGWSLRRAADEIGVSFNTIARVEAGNLPDLDNYTKLAAWLGFAGDEPAEPTATTIDAITTHLLQDPALRPGDADRIARLVKDMYEALAQPLEAKAVHLRSAATFKPIAGRMLGELLDDMRAALDSDGAA